VKKDLIGHHVVAKTESLYWRRKTPVAANSRQKLPGKAHPRNDLHSSAKLLVLSACQGSFNLKAQALIRVQCASLGNIFGFCTDIFGY